LEHQEVYIDINMNPGHPASGFFVSYIKDGFAFITEELRVIIPLTVGNTYCILRTIKAGGRDEFPCR